MVRNAILALIATLAFWAAHACAEGFGGATHAVHGVVITTDGLPVPGAQVWALPLPSSGRGIAGDFSPVNADAHGHFALRLSPGRYVIRAKSDRGGYPNPDAILSRDPTAHFPIVTVAAQNISGVIVRLGKKGAFLQGEVYDVRSMAPIPNAKVTIRDAHNSKGILILTCDNSGRFQYVLPSKPILISAGAAGYRTKHFAGGRPVTLSSGEHRTISFKLGRE